MKANLLSRETIKSLRSSIYDFFSEFKAWRHYKSLPPEVRKVVFYSEGSWDWPHLKPLVDEILSSGPEEICYLYSAKDDPVSQNSDPRIRKFNIGSGAIRSLVYQGLEANVFVSTLPDLDTDKLKRSPYPVHYVYVFHSLNSTHTGYQTKAFDAFDTIFCTGLYQVMEIKKNEELHGLKRKNLLPIGYFKLDALIRKNKIYQSPPHEPKGNPKILLAPSWGAGSFIESEFGLRVVHMLLDRNYPVTLRLHPMTKMRFPSLVKTLSNLNSINPLFKLITDLSEEDSFFSSDLLISDWSGAAAEYAFVRERPVIFLETPAKINNPHFSDLGIQPFEIKIREKIGLVVKADDEETLSSTIDQLVADAPLYRGRIINLRDENLYNLGKSAQVGASYIRELLSKVQV